MTMQLTVSPKDIAEHLIREYGHEAARDEFIKRFGNCGDEVVNQIWQQIGDAIEYMTPQIERAA